MEDTKKFKCPDCKCFLNEIYPNSDASLACDSNCYFSEGEEGQKYLKWYINKFKDKWEQFNNNQ